MTLENEESQENTEIPASETPSHSSDFHPPESPSGLLVSIYKDFSMEFLWFVLTAIVGTILGFTAFGGLFLDIYSNILPSDPVSEDVTVVSIGPQALYLWDPANPSPEVTPREMLAELIEILTELEATTISIDITLSSAEAGDDRLARAAAAHGAVIAAEEAQVNLPSEGSMFAAGITPILSAENPSGSSIISPGHVQLYMTEPILFGDNLIVRGVPLVLRYDRLNLNQTWSQQQDSITLDPGFTPALSLATAWLYRAKQRDPGASIYTLTKEINSICSYEGSTLNCTSSTLSFLPDLQVPLHENYRLWHTGPEQGDAIHFLPAAELLLQRSLLNYLQKIGLPESEQQYNDELRKQIKGKAVIIGRVDQNRNSNDRHPTTYSFPFFTDSDMSGVHIQAQLIERMLSGKTWHPVPTWLHWLLGVLAAVLSWRTVKRQPIILQIPILSLYFLYFFVAGLLLMALTGWVLELGIPITTGMLSFIMCHLWYTHQHAEESPPSS